jgi:hypothetical protein
VRGSKYCQFDPTQNAGNGCRQILRKLESLEEVLPAQHRPFLTALYAFRQLRQMVTKVSDAIDLLHFIYCKWEFSLNLSAIFRAFSTKESIFRHFLS